MNVRDTLRDMGLAPAKSRGQNFLKDENAIEALSRAIRQEAHGAKILEIGPGLGALTRPLLAAGATVTAVELDRGLAEGLSALAAEYPRLTVLHQDVLTLDPAPLAESGPLFLCGNLPYNISSPVLLWFMRHLSCFTGAVFMLQKEMAERLTARPGTKAYGRLTVLVGLWCELAEVLTVGPEAFHPRPQVASAAVRLRPRPAAPPVSVASLGRFTAAAFAARRKTLGNNLAKAYGREKALVALAAQGIAPGARAETLPPGQLAALASLLEDKQTALGRDDRQAELQALFQAEMPLVEA